MIQNIKNKIEVYTDGACEPNPGPGAWGSHIIMPDGEIVELDGFEAQSTNQRMELSAPIESLKHLPKNKVIIVYSDSQYVIKGITGWIDNWKRNGWRNAKREPVANRELWEEFDSVVSRRVRFQWVRGHDGNPGNERADYLARKRLFKELAGNEKAVRAAVRGFDRHGDFDASQFL